MKDVETISDENLPQVRSYFILGEIIGKPNDDYTVKLKIVSMGPEALSEKFIKSYSKETGRDIKIKNGGILGNSFNFLTSILCVSYLFTFRKRKYVIFPDEQFLRKCIDMHGGECASR